MTTEASNGFETMETAPNEAATSARSLTIPSPETAKTRGERMATPNDRPTLRPDDPRHGTLAGYSQHRRDGEDACQPCREASALYERRRRKLTKMRGRGYRVDSLGTTRRIRALMALGHTAESIAKEGGWKGRNRPLLICKQDHVSPAMAARVARVYDRMSMLTPPIGARADRLRRIAVARGWFPPLAWDNIDDPDEQPSRGVTDAELIDEVKVQRVLSGWLEDCNTAERYAVIEAWRGTKADLERLTGWNLHRMMKREAA